MVERTVAYECRRQQERADPPQGPMALNVARKINVAPATSRIARSGFPMFCFMADCAPIWIYFESAVRTEDHSPWIVHVESLRGVNSFRIGRLWRKVSAVRFGVVSRGTRVRCSGRLADAAPRA
jgi:hypothetical protein